MAQYCFVVKCDLKGVDINSFNNIDCNSPRNGSVLFVFLVKILEVDYVSQYIKIKPITSSSVSYRSKVVLSIPPVHEDSL